jgi:hypothetical protein
MLECRYLFCYILCNEYIFADYLSMLFGRNISGILSYSVTYFHQFMQINFFLAFSSDDMCRCTIVDFPNIKKLGRRSYCEFIAYHLLWPYSPVNNNFTNVELVHLQINSACVGAVSSIITLGPDPTDFGDYGQL